MTVTCPMVMSMPVAGGARPLVRLVMGARLIGAPRDTLGRLACPVNPTAADPARRTAAVIPRGMARPKHPCVRVAASRFACHATVAGGKGKVVFLGTPEVVAEEVLQPLLDAAEAGGEFEVVAVVAQPGRPRGRGKKIAPSPVEAMAIEQGVPHIFTPEKARDEEFLGALEALAPDLCITAAYGNVLPQRFLDIPRLGTLNIHPSLLPAYRGASPVQRAVEAGLPDTGVSVAYTVRAMDAGPVLAQERVAIDPDIKAPDLLADLFRVGTRRLLSELPRVMAGEGDERATPQDEAAVTHADKLSKAEGALDFSRPARELHDKVRAFAGWPGTTAVLVLTEEGAAGPDAPGAEELVVKILTSRVVGGAGGEGGGCDGAALRVECRKDALVVPCGGGGALEVLELQPPNKRAMAAGSFVNGLRGKWVWRRG